MAEPALQRPPNDNEVDISDLIRQRDGNNALDISDQIRRRDAVPGPEGLPDDQSGSQQPGVVDRAQDLKDQFDQGKELYGKGKEKLAAHAEKKAGKGELKGVEKRGADAAKAAKGRVTTQAGEKVGQAAVQTGARTAATVGTEAAVTAGAAEAGAVAGSVVPIVGTAIGAVVGWLAGKLLPKVLDFAKNNWKYAVYAVAALLLLLAVPFGLLGGKGSPQYPATQAQQDQVTALSAVSGNSVARAKLKFNKNVSEKKRMTQFKIWSTQIYSGNSAKAGSASGRINEVLVLIGTLEVTSAATAQKPIINQIQTKLSSISTDFPELVGFGAVNGFPLDVPGVIEAEGGDCGAASVLMVSLYYKQTPEDDIYDAKIKASRKKPGAATAGSICVVVSPDYLKSHTPYKDWEYASSSKASFTSVKKSLAAGNPVVLYLAAGGIYGPKPITATNFGGRHIVVIVGYDPADQTFFINNPLPGGVVVATKTPNGRQMTESRIQQFLGEKEPSFNGHTYIIRGAFLP